MSADCREERGGAGVWAAVRRGGDAKVTGDVEVPLKDIRVGSQSSNESSRDTGKKNCSLGAMRDPRLEVEPAAKETTEGAVPTRYTIELSAGSDDFLASASDMSLERCEHQTERVERNLQGREDRRASSAVCQERRG